MIGHTNINEKLTDMTPNRTFLDEKMEGKKKTTNI